LRELLKETSKLDKEAFDIRLAREQEKQPKRAEQPAPSEDLYLAEQTQKLVEQYPFVNNLTAEDLEPCRALAYREAEQEGKPIKPVHTERLNFARGC